MSDVPADLKYTEHDEWIRVEADGTPTIGITDFAQGQLGDIVFSELPEAGRAVTKDEAIAVVGSVKAASDIFTPAAGEIAANSVDTAGVPEPVSAGAYEAWPFKIKPTNAGDVNALISAADYEAKISQSDPPAGARTLTCATHRSLLASPEFRALAMNAPHPASSALAAEHPTLADLEARDAFTHRHIGPSADEQTAVLGIFGYTSRATLIDAVIPSAIRRQDGMPLDEFTQPLTEKAALTKLRGIAGQNRVVKSLIGQGYYGTHTSGVILRNILENPAWYTTYTPYQPEISQGRLGAMLNFQQMVIDLTAMDITDASMLDEATAAAEAMTLLQRVGKSKSTAFLVAGNVLSQTLEVVRTHAEPIGVQVVTGPAADAAKHDAFGVLLQYPGANGMLPGDLATYQALADAVHAAGGLVVAAADLLALTLLAAPGEWGADVVIGNTQRFGVSFGFGDPHASYMAVCDALRRSMLDRLVGVTIDV